MKQTALFHDTIFDAIGADIAAAGGFKAVAGKIWPAEPVETTTARLRNGINSEQPQKLCPSEVLAIKRLAREAGSTATVDYEAQQLGFQVTWIDPRDESDALLREVHEMLAAVNRKLGLKADADERARRAGK